jgi:hypothetical protein
MKQSMVSVRSHTILARAVGAWSAAIGYNDGPIHSSRRGVVALKDTPSTPSRVSCNVSLNPLKGIGLESSLAARQRRWLIVV